MDDHGEYILLFASLAVGLFTVGVLVVPLKYLVALYVLSALVALPMFVIEVFNG